MAYFSVEVLLVVLERPRLTWSDEIGPSRCQKSSSTLDTPVLALVDNKRPTTVVPGCNVRSLSFSPALVQPVASAMSGLLSSPPTQYGQNSSGAAHGDLTPTALSPQFDHGPPSQPPIEAMFTQIMLTLQKSVRHSAPFSFCRII